MDRQRLERTLWRPLDPDWDSDPLSRLVAGPPTLAHLLVGVIVGLLIAFIYVVAG